MEACTNYLSKAKIRNVGVECLCSESKESCSCWHILTRFTYSLITFSYIVFTFLPSNFINFQYNRNLLIWTSHPADNVHRIFRNRILVNGQFSHLIRPTRRALPHFRRVTLPHRKHLDLLLCIGRIHGLHRFCIILPWFYIVRLRRIILFCLCKCTYIRITILK